MTMQTPMDRTLSVLVSGVLPGALNALDGFSVVGADDVDAEGALEQRRAAEAAFGVDDRAAHRLDETELPIEIVEKISVVRIVCVEHSAGRVQEIEDDGHWSVGGSFGGSGVGSGFGSAFFTPKGIG
mgnify:CR=1 FL=1